MIIAIKTICERVLTWIFIRAVFVLVVKSTIYFNTFLFNRISWVFSEFCGRIFKLHWSHSLVETMHFQCKTFSFYKNYLNSLRAIFSCSKRISWINDKFWGISKYDSFKTTRSKWHIANALIIHKQFFFFITLFWKKWSKNIRHCLRQDLLLIKSYSKEFWIEKQKPRTIWLFHFIHFPNEFLPFIPPFSLH